MKTYFKIRVSNGISTVFFVKFGASEIEYSTEHKATARAQELAVNNPSDTFEVIRFTEEHVITFNHPEK